MREGQDIRYLLSCAEWALLLAAAGVKEIYGFPFPQENYSRSQVIDILEGLVKSGRAVSDGKIFHLQPEIREIIKCVRECENVLCLEDGGGLSVCLYVGNDRGLTAVIPADNRRDCLCVWQMDEKELEVWMQDAGCLPEAYLPPESIPAGAWEEEDPGMIWQMVKREAKSGEPEKLLFLQQGGLYFRLLRQSMSMEEEPWEFYGEQQMRRALAWMMEE